MWNKLVAFWKAVWRRLQLINWAGAILSVLKAVKKEDQKIEPKYLAIKPRMFSDQNILRGVAALKAVLTFVPPAAIAAPVLGLGEMGFNIWKNIALRQDYNQIKFPPVDPNVMRVNVQFDEELNKHYGHLTLAHNWDQEATAELEKVYNDFSFITSFELLHTKYPHVDEEYVKTVCIRNRELLNANLYQIEQEIFKVSKKPEIETNVQDAVKALKDLFPAMRNWALFNSEGFEEVIEIIDTVI